jgi:GMP synthase-like glutamine amidotransferase
MHTYVTTPELLYQSLYLLHILSHCSMASQIRICMLNADIPVPNVFAQRAPTYGRIFNQLLGQASPNITIQSTDFDVIQDEYPRSLENFDAIIVSGSANSAYDDLPWIHKLDAYIRDVYAHHTRVKIFGSCFGHQIVCQSLLKEYGVKVEQDPNGWEIGVKEVELHPRFRKVFGKRTNSVNLADSMRLQFVHHDHVVIPSPELLPTSWMSVGSTQHCAVQGVYEPGRVLTLQGHFEFDRFVNRECVKHFFEPTWEAERLEEALAAIEADDDSPDAARIIIKFFLQEEAFGESMDHRVVGGLLTPPDEL